MIRSAILLLLVFSVTSCGKNDDNPVKSDPVNDYRDVYTGTYDATKSTRSFEDDIFAMDIEVTVQVSSEGDSLILINDFEVVVNDDGTLEDGVLAGAFIGDSIKFYNRPIVNGISLPCFIKGVKQ